MDVPGLAQKLSSDGNACKRRLSLCYYLGVPKEEIADIASMNHNDFFSHLLENWIRRNDKWHLDGLNNALAQIGAAKLGNPSLPEVEEDANAKVETTNENEVQRVRPSVLQTHSVGELPSTSSGAYIVNDIAEAAPVIRHIKFECEHGISAAQYSSLSERCLSPSCPPQPFQSWETAKQGPALMEESVEAMTAQEELVTSESTIDSSTTTDPVAEFEPESKPKIASEKPTCLNATNIMQYLEMLDQQNSEIPEQGLDIPRIASLLSANRIAYNRREAICYHLGIPKEDLQFIISLPPYQFFSKLLWSWELRDDAWAEIRLARALDHIGIHNDSNDTVPAVAIPDSASTVVEPVSENEDSAEPCTKRQKNHSDSEECRDKSNPDPDTVSQCSTQADMETEEPEPTAPLKKASRSRAKLAASKVFGSRKRLVDVEKRKHHLELTRSFDRNRNNNSLKLAKLNKFVSMYLKASLKVIQSIPTDKTSIDDAPTLTMLQKTKNDFTTARRVYRQSRLLKKNILKRERSSIKSADRNDRNMLVQAEPIYGIYSCHI